MPGEIDEVQRMFCQDKERCYESLSIGTRRYKSDMICKTDIRAY